MPEGGSRFSVTGFYSHNRPFAVCRHDARFIFDTEQNGTINYIRIFNYIRPSICL